MRSARALPLVPLLLASLVLSALLLASCGRGDDPARPGRAGSSPPDRSSPEIVLVQAHRALTAGDWAGLEPFLSVEGRARVEADLRAWHAVLTDPVTGPRVAARVPVPPDEGGRAIVRRAIADGDVPALLWLLARADPRPALPPSAPAVRAPDARRVELTYPARGAEQRRVVLSRAADGWRIDRVQL